MRHNKSKAKKEKKRRFHDQLVDTILNDPGMITIDGSHIEPHSIKSGSKEIFIGNRDSDYRVDIVLIRDVGPHAGEVDIIEALSTPYGIGMMGACKSLGGKISPFFRNYPDYALWQLKDRMGLDADCYSWLGLDILMAYPDFIGIKFERLPGYKKGGLVKSNGIWHWNYL